jgi:hypothetical protein
VGIFFASHQPVVPEIHNAIRVALLVDPNLIENAEDEASQRTLDVVRATAAQFQPLRFFCALMIAGALLLGAIWAAQHNLPDISKDLMNSFACFGGVVIGLLGGEAQKSTYS